MNDYKVKSSSDNGHRFQWAKNIFYRKEGVKHVFKTEKARVVVFIIFIILTIFLLIQDDPIVNEMDSSIKGPSEIVERSSPLKIKSYKEKKVVKKIKKSPAVNVQKLSVVSRKSEFLIPIGSMAKAVLVTGATNGPVKAKLIENLEANGDLIIPEGSVLWGKGSSTDRRLQISFSKVVFEDGTTKDLSGNAYDKDDNMLGLRGSIIGRTSRKVLAGSALGVAGALKTMQEAQNVGGVAVAKPTFKNGLLNGASEAALGVAEQELEELKSKQTIIEVPKGTEVLVVFGKG